jgi:hypothetical protein
MTSKNDHRVLARQATGDLSKAHFIISLEMEDTAEAS